MTIIDERIARHRELSQKRDEIDRELQLLSDELKADLKLLLGALATDQRQRTAVKAKTVRKCGVCGGEGHNAKTCPSTRPAIAADITR